MSKIVNTEEFMALASIVDDLHELSDEEHELSEEQKRAIRLHWKNNSHHPEYYDSPDDITDLDLLEMACDIHARSKQFGTDLLKYVEVQQVKRYHFGKSHYKKLWFYCKILTELTLNDDYSSIKDYFIPANLSLKDSTLARLAEFNVSGYSDFVKTERLFLEKGNTPDFASMVYGIHLQDGNNTKIGQITILATGEIIYKIFENYKGNGYAQEALMKLKDIVMLRELYININRENEKAIKVATDVGFKADNPNTKSDILRFKLIRSD
jgi:RimJ/RimL family protein N-acetyltransferase